MSVRNNTRQKIVDNTRHELNTQTNNFSNDGVSNECNNELKRNILCYYRDNKASFDDMRIFSVGYSESSDLRNKKEQNRIYNLEDIDQDILISQPSNFVNPDMDKGNSERKWRMVYADRIYKNQTLHPCPTCGRKFNDEAALRHFPICLRGKEKRALALLQKQKKLSGDIKNAPLRTINENGNVEKKEETSFQRTDKKQTPPVKDKNRNTSSMSSNIPIVAEPKIIHLDSNGGNFSSKDQAKQVNNKKTNNKITTIQSETNKKSATIQKQSGKELEKSNTKSSSVKKNEEANVNKDAILEGESSQTWNGNRAVGKLFGPHTSFNNEFRSSPHQNNENTSETVPKTKPPKNLNVNAGSTSNNNTSFMNDLDIIPENIPFKKDQNIRSLLIYAPDRKTSICGICGSNVKEDNLENHLEFCLRIKRLESSFIKETNHSQCTQSMVKLTDNSISIENAQYCLLRNVVGDSSLENELKSIVSLKCPCCFTLLDLYKTN